MKCEILDFARIVLKDRRLNCGEVCMKDQRCPFVNDGRVFPAIHVSGESDESAPLYLEKETPSE